ncbi:MAG TPA: NAD-dependent epimerase/dehydratase family protein [Candidatus Polarisedimenticolaceae bacterium]|nr:NAD-dependent epimerase/dehydratase family protein [Candidatus Polarisedimenticolaceae bacterium]
MSPSRREFLVAAGTTVAAASIGLSCKKEKETAEAQPAPASKKRILILGGTGFLGPKTVEAALARGHDVTIFNRGKREKTLPFPFKNVEHLYGNRDPLVPADDERGPDGKLLHPDATPKGLEQLQGKTWDAVIDNSGFYPRMVKASAELLAPNAKQYIFISTLSAYAENKTIGADETAALATLADPTVETMGPNFENYGGLKALCEKATEAAFPGRAAIVRPGFIVGPGDQSDRFTYWPVRMSRGGEVLAPGTAEDPTEWIDVRDLAEWLVKLVENGTAGAFNAIGPERPAKWGDVLAGCAAAAKTPTSLTWIPGEWLEKNGQGEDAFPIWVPPGGETAGFHTRTTARAIQAGLTFRPITDTAAATLAWYPEEIARRVRVTAEMAEAAKAKGAEPPKMADPNVLRAGPSPQREAELLKKWKVDRGQPAGTTN